MAVKHIEEYYKKICKDYLDFVNELEDFAKEAEKGMIEPERLEQIKQDAQPLMMNYERWSYMMFLLHMPNRKEKKKAYEIRNKKAIENLSKSNNLEACLGENQQALSQIKKDIKRN